MAIESILDNLELAPDIIEELSSWTQWFDSEVRATRLPNRLRAPVPESIAKVVRTLLRDVSAVDDIAVEEITRCFGLDDSSRLISHGSNRDAHIAIEKQTNRKFNVSKALRYELTIGKEATDFSFFIPEDVPLEIQGVHNFSFVARRMPVVTASDDKEQTTAKFALGVLCDLLFPQAVGSLSQRAYYLPADRTGVMHAHRVVVSSLIGRAPRAGLGPQSPLPVLSGVLADFLEVLIGLRDIQQRNPQSENTLADQLGGTDSRWGDSQ